ncbi:hypothetical protein RHGRI_010989 [Rhododendron griersonianum]|uniref:Uncharacterized protein n=1 Tax=Rhododendron griersonianum TaxID=479676 RepID=A0AAV6KKH6_9ERIC|nr:hypothetical protein RHGRI_010989 [Rhododendron griersonianum]
MHCSRHAKTRGGQGMASQLLVSGQGNALFTACQNKGWQWHSNPIVCHRARQCIAHGMPRPRVAKAWQADCLSPGKAMHCSRHAKTKGGQGMTHGIPKQGVAKAWQTDCLSPGKAMHCSRHAKTRGGQGMASRLLVTGQGNAFLTA